jgi:hypothetical protein
MLLNPRDQGRAAMLLQGGGIMGRRFQPYESHIPYLLQFKVRIRRLSPQLCASLNIAGCKNKLS